MHLIVHIFDTSLFTKTQMELQLVFKVFVWASLLRLPMAIPCATSSCLESRDKERPICEPSSFTNLGAFKDICFSWKKKKRFRLPSSFCYSHCFLTWNSVSGWHCNYTLWQWLIGKWEMGLKGFVGIWTGSCCMTNEQRERWAAEQMHLTHVPLQMHSEIWL